MNIMYDLLMRLPLLGWVVLSAITQLQGLGQFMTAPIDSVYVIHIACDSRQSDLCCSSPPAVILRTRPSGKASELEPRISALAGSSMMYVIVFFRAANCLGHWR